MRPALEWRDIVPGAQTVRRVGAGPVSPHVPPAEVDRQPGRAQPGQAEVPARAALRVPARLEQEDDLRVTAAREHEDRAVWQPRPGLATSAECWLTAGGPHHTVLSQAVGTEELSDFTEMVGIELLIIGADTDRRSFANEIRWNTAAYRLGVRR